MKKMTIAMLGVALAAGCCGIFAGNKVQLAEDGQAKARIVIAKDATRTAKFGAADLKWHLDKITGANFEIVTDDQVSQPSQLLINVGPTKFTKTDVSDFRRQEFLVDIRTDGIDLVGQDFDDRGALDFTLDEVGRVTGKVSGWPEMFKPQNSLYAVYEFLENVVGVRWIDPSDYGAALPSDANLAVAVGRTRTEPFLRYRGGTGIDRVRCYSPHVNNQKACRQLEFASYRDGKNDHLSHWQDRLFLLRHRAGGEMAEANHSFYGWYDRFWQKNEKAPQYWEGAHPDWFAKGYAGKPPQLCYSNPEVIAQAIKDGRDYLDNGGYPVKDKTGKIVRREPKWGENQFCLEPMDAGSMCQCPKCTPQYEPNRATEASFASTCWFRFVKQVAEELLKSHPDKYVATLAYGEHQGVPTGVVLPKNVLVYFCITGNRTLCGQKLEEHGEFKRMLDWRKAYPDQPLAMWLYNTFPDEHYRGMGIKGVPGFFAREAEAQYRFFRKLNVRGGLFHCGFNGEVDNYMQLEWMVNPDRSADEMLAEFFAPYGETGKWLKKFYSLVEERYTMPGIRVEGASLSQESCWGRVITAKEMARLTEFMEKATAAATNEKERTFALSWKLAVYDYMKEGFDTYRVRAASPEPEWTAKRIAAANGDLGKVDWEKMPLVEMPTYWRGGVEVSPVKATARCAHDGKWLYVELTEFLDTSLLKGDKRVVCGDEMELNIGFQKASPYRNWFCSPAGDWTASSCQEVNFRWCVPDTEHGCPKFGAKYESDVSKPDRWRMRWAFPFDTMLNRRVEPGTDLFFNAVMVLWPQHDKTLGFRPKGSKLGIIPLVSFTSVHAPDRAVTIHLEK